MLATAPLVALFGTSTEVIRVVPLVCTAVAAVLVWRIGIRTVGEPAARIAAVFFWVWPPYLVWKSERAHGFYGSGLVFVCLILLLVLRLSERRSRVDAALLGLVLGLGWWQTPQVLPIALPALAWLLWKQREIWRDVWIVLPLAVLGALPWLLSNVANDWWSFDVDSGQTPYPTRLRGFFSATFPMALGLRIPFTSEWPLGKVLSAVAYAGLVVLFAIGWWRRRSSPTRSPVRRRRRLPVPLRAVAVDLDRGRAPLRRGAPARGLAPGRAGADDRLAGRRGDSRCGRTLPARAVAPDVVAGLPGAGRRALRSPADFGPVIAELDRRGLEHVFASYWPAYRIDFETDERIVAAEAHSRRSASRMAGWCRASRGRTTRAGIGPTTGSFAPTRARATSCSAMRPRTSRRGGCSNAQATCAGRGRLRGLRPP